MVNVVELDPIIAADARAVAPHPADGDGGVVEVADLVVRHGIAKGVHDQHTHAAVEEPAKVMEPVVHDNRLARAERLRVDGSIDLDSSRGDPGQLVSREADPATAIAQVDTVTAEVLEHTPLDRDMPRPGGDHRARDVARGLRVHRVAGTGLPGRIGERQALKGEVVYKPAGPWNSPELDQARKSRHDDMHAICRSHPHAACNAACQNESSRRNGRGPAPRTHSRCSNGRGPADARR